MGQEQNSSNNPQQTSGDRKAQPGSSNPNNPSAKQNADSQGQSCSTNKQADWDQGANKNSQQKQPSWDQTASRNPQQQEQAANPQQLKTKLKEAFGRLSEDEIALYDTQKDQFFTKLEDKYGLAREEAEDRVHEIEVSQKAA